MDQHANNTDMDNIVALRIALYYACYKLCAQDEQLAIEIMNKMYDDGLRAIPLVEKMGKEHKEKA